MKVDKSWRISSGCNSLFWMSKELIWKRMLSIRRRQGKLHGTMSVKGIPQVSCKNRIVIISWMHKRVNRRMGTGRQMTNKIAAPLQVLKTRNREGVGLTTQNRYGRPARKARRNSQSRVQNWLKFLSRGATPKRIYRSAIVQQANLSGLPNTKEILGCDATGDMGNALENIQICESFSL